MKSDEIRNMTKIEVENKLIALKEQLFKIRSEAMTGRIERPNRFRALRKDIARCNTILKEKSIEEK